jgi:hypothetical protein
MITCFESDRAKVLSHSIGIILDLIQLVLLRNPDPIMLGP